MASDVLLLVFLLCLRTGISRLVANLGNLRQEVWTFALTSSLWWGFSCCHCLRSTVSLQQIDPWTSAGNEDIRVWGGVFSALYALIGLLQFPPML